MSDMGFAFAQDGPLARAIDGYRRRPEQHNHRHLDEHRKHNGNGMKTNTGGNIEIRIGVVHAV